MALDDLSVDHLRLIEQRIAAHEQAPESSIESTQMIAELREKYCP